MNLFSWSIPFVTEKVAEVFYHLFKPDQKYEEKEEDLPIEFVMHQQLLETVLESTRKQAGENLELVALGGNCPDEKLL